jgi:hypothetical protein
MALRTVLETPRVSGASRSAADRCPLLHGPRQGRRDGSGVGQAGRVRTLVVSNAQQRLTPDAASDEFRAPGSWPLPAWPVAKRYTTTITANTYPRRMPA